MKRCFRLFVLFTLSLLRLEASADCPKGSIFVVHHRPFISYESALYKNICTNTKNYPSAPDMLMDNTFDHISDKNPSYSEMTAIYWVWKNIPLEDFVGFCHYRRYLNTSPVSKGAQITLSDLSSGLTKFSDFISEENVVSLMKEYDLILPNPMHLPPSIRAQYAFCHYKKDFEVMFECLLRSFPEHAETIKNACNSPVGYMNNCFIMRSGLFQEYADWMFSVFAELEKEIVVNTKNAYQQRVFAFLSERLFTVFITIKKKEGSLKIKELPLTYIQD